ncbi:ABC transporter permease [Paenibacillus tepidiphilus]|uniref:ABC transporter permease n=1 Tax=Paenibacillus tepidiphilus TaxID=2608683 RepID=UPI0012395D86|nr:ABC-2 family transporter protein [Paenibacillus tepidiphilus]
MRRLLRIYRVCVMANLATAISYRMNFILNCLITLIGNVLFPLVTVIIYQSNASFAGWTFHEALLIQAVFILSTACASLLFNGIMWSTMSHVVEGSLEVLLIKPAPGLFLLLAQAFNIESIGLLAGGLAIFGYALGGVGGMTLMTWLLFLLLFAAGLLVMLGVVLIVAAISFKWVANSRLPEMFESVKAFGRYPGTIFPKMVVAISSFIFPVSMIAFFPASALIGRWEGYYVAAILPCLLFAGFGIWLYNRMLHSYKSAGG